ncbi:MAG: DUF6600 domain-containing protein, partial [Rhodanobacter sp.]
YPNDVGTDWAPYRNGHWAYIAPWGWTWIDSAPWGYAPYHYGRWAHTPRGWGWIPGPRYARPIYAPALVAFVGGGGGFSVGVSSGPVGWFPLGPGEVYNPWYRCNQNYYTRINVTNIRIGRRHDERNIRDNINDHYAHYRDNRPLQGERYANRYAPRGITAMSGHDFAAGQRVQRHRLRDDQQLATAPVRPHGANLRPIPVNLTASSSEHTRNLPLNGFRRDVVARHAPPQAVVERRLDANNRMNETARMAVPVSHVRVLGQPDRRPGRMERARPIAGTGDRSAITQPNGPRDANVTPNASIAPRGIDGAAEPVIRGRGNVLPSARFAHPARNSLPERDERQRRPRVSYISSDNRPHPENNPQATGLPQVPHIERAEPAERAMPSNRFVPRQVEPREPAMVRPNRFGRRDVEPRFQRAQPERAMPNRSEAPQQIMAQPRFVPSQRSAAPMRTEPPRSMPNRSEAPRPVMQQPRFVPSERREAPARAAGTPPPRSSPPPERKAQSHRDQLKGYRQN